MALTPDSQISSFQERALRAYEQSRISYGIRMFACVLVGVVCVAGLSEHRLPVCVMGLGLAGILGWAAFYGCVYRAAALSGLLAGSMPVVLMLMSHNSHYLCFLSGSCGSRCMLLCMCSGAVGSMIVAKCAGAFRETRAYWGVASGVALLTSSLSCGCVGYASLFAWGCIFFVSLIPARLWVCAHEYP